MKKYLKHSVYLAILLSSISAGAVYAEVHDYDKPVSYDEVLNVRGKIKRIFLMKVLNLKVVSTQGGIVLLRQILAGLLQLQ